MKIHMLGTGHGDPTPERFNTAALLETGSRFYLLDAGAPAAVLIRKNLPMSRLRAVFITHMHEDHFDGLAGILKFQLKYAPENGTTEVWLPEKRAGKLFRTLLSAAHLPIDAMPGKLLWKTIRPGFFFDDGFLRMEAIPTRHMHIPEGHFPSYAFLICAEGRKVLYTGDLAKDFSDFPLARASEADSCICELTHIRLDSALPVFGSLPLKKLIFSHVGNDWHGAEAEKHFAEKTKVLPYETVLAHDGDIYEF